MIKWESILAVLYLGRKATLQCELRFQIIKLSATTFINNFSRSVKDCEVRVASRDLSPKPEKHPTMHDDRCNQNGEKNGSER